MNLELARKTIAETFRQKFDDVRFLYFIRNLVNHLDESDDRKKTWTKQIIKAAFQDYVNHYTRLGTYSDPDGEKVDVLVIYLCKDTTLSRGRVTLRNFVADYLATGHGQGKAAVMAAFVSPDKDDWRFSFVKLDFTFEKADLGFVSEIRHLTPARRYSYLVGKNENCHTAQKQFLALLAVEEINPKIAQLEAAFSVEKVTKEFFDHYRELFEKTRDALAVVLDSTPALKEHFNERGIACDDFAKKLLGQIVFLYFLQKKGWFGVARGQDWGKGRKDFIRHLFANRADYVSGLRKRPVNFFNDILEPLFYEAIAAPRTDDDHYYSRFDCRIPFLNGGLFEPLYGYNWVETEILLPDTLFANTEPTGEEDEKGTGILDVFDRYNFTVNESEPLEKEVAVDPEMLGKVFENLLPENIRHSSGTYYTPRVIVHYMCQQALLHYLTARAAQIPPTDLASFLRLAERYADFEAKETKAHADKLLPEAISQNAGQLDDLLAAITVCDPAIGSGAFPVGMMHEIVRARMALTGAMEKQNDPRTKKPRTAYVLKRDAIQHSLYGVDLDPGAVEIAKLRLWLSMVVDEDEIRDIQPLPNLDYKIMQGNSLLEEFNGVRLLDDKLLQPPAASRDAEIAELKTRVSALQAEAIRLHGEGKKGAAQKLAAEQDIKRLKKRLVALVNPGEAGVDAQGELNQQTSWANLKRIQELHDQFFDENARAKKDKLRKDLDALEWNFMEATLREQGRTEAIAELKRASVTHRKPFFLWRLHFGEVFQQHGGFDVVVGNPPYVRIQEIKKADPQTAEVLRACYASASKGNYDLYVTFVEQGLRLLGKGGQLAYILPHKFFNAEYGEPLRKVISRGKHLRHVVHFGDQQIFEGATNYVCLLFLANAGVESCRWTRADDLPAWLQTLRAPEIELPTSRINAAEWNFMVGEGRGLFDKLQEMRVKLEDVAEMFVGVQTDADDVFIVECISQDRDKLVAYSKYTDSEHEFEASHLKPFLKGSLNVRRYVLTDLQKRLIFPYEIRNGVSHLITPKDYEQKFPLTWAYLKACKDRLSKRSKGEFSDFWHGYVYKKNHTRFEQSKLVVPAIGAEMCFAADFEGHFYFVGSGAGGGGGYGITLKPETQFGLKYLLAILNSSPSYFLLKQVSTPFRGGYFALTRQFIAQIPIPAALPAQQKVVEVLVDRILAAKAKDGTADVSQLEREIDQQVYVLFNLTPEEIKLVEGTQPEKTQPVIAEPTLPKGKRQTLGGVKYAIQLVQALLTESPGGLSWPRLIDAFTLATQPSLMAQETASADAAKVKAWTKRWNETLPPGALITAIEQLGAANLAVKKSGNTWRINLKNQLPKSSAEDVNYDAWLALRMLGPAPEVQLAAPVFAAPLFADWTRTIEALAA